MLPLSSDDGDGLRVATARGGGETERESEGNARRIERRQASERRGEREGVGGKERKGWFYERVFMGGGGGGQWRGEVRFSVSVGSAKMLVFRKGEFGTGERERERGWISDDTQGRQVLSRELCGFFFFFFFRERWMAMVEAFRFSFVAYRERV